MMDEIAADLSPAECWVWVWLSQRWQAGGSPVIAIGSGCGPPRYSRHHLRRILAGLGRKKYLVLDHVPKNQYQDLVVVLETKKCLLCQVRAENDARTEMSGQEIMPGQGCSGNRLKRGFEGVGQTGMSGRREGGKDDGYTDLRGCPNMGVRAETQLSLSLRLKEIKESLKAWTEMGQKGLLRAIKRMSDEGVAELKWQVMRGAPWSRNRKLSEKAKLFAAIRFLQYGTQARNPVAWVEGVAKLAQRDLDRI